MPFSAIFILDNNRGTLLYRDYRGDVDLNVIEEFTRVLNENEDLTAPILHTHRASFAYLKLDDLYLVSVMKRNANVLLVFLLMYKLVEIMTKYFNKLEEESIKDNFVLIYELLDEIIDFGYPQITDAKILQSYITQESYKLNKLQLLPPVVTNVVSWRPEGIKYRKNEVFIDVIESVNLSLSTKGTVLNHEVAGCVKVKVHLSGMPQLRLGLSNKIMQTINNQFEGVKFHQCVQLSRIHEKNIHFIPPDGDFELMSYRLSPNLKPLIIVECNTKKYSHSRIEYEVRAISQFKTSSTANNVEIVLPVAQDVDSPLLKTSTGNASYDPGKSAVVWRIKFFQGGLEHFLQAQFKLCSIGAEDREKRIPVQIKFTIPYFTISGLQVKFIKVIEKSNYKALTWVRYTTQNGGYFINFNN